MGLSKKLVRWHTSFKYQHNIEYHTLNAKCLRGEVKFFCIVKSLSLNPKSIVNTNKTCNCYNAVLWSWHYSSQEITLYCDFINFPIKYWNISSTIKACTKYFIMMVLMKLFFWNVWWCVTSLFLSLCWKQLWAPCDLYKHFFTSNLYDSLKTTLWKQMIILVLLSARMMTATTSWNLLNFFKSSWISWWTALSTSQRRDLGGNTTNGNLH